MRPETPVDAACTHGQCLGFAKLVGKTSPRETPLVRGVCVLRNLQGSLVLELRNHESVCFSRKCFSRNHAVFVSHESCETLPYGRYGVRNWEFDARTQLRADPSLGTWAGGRRWWATSAAAALPTCGSSPTSGTPPRCRAQRHRTADATPARSVVPARVRDGHRKGRAAGRPNALSAQGGPQSRDREGLTSSCVFFCRSSYVLVTLYMLLKKHCGNVKHQYAEYNIKFVIVQSDC